MKENQEGFSMPLSAPAYAPPPYWGRPEGDLLLVFFHTDRNILEYEVPEPLKLAPDPLCCAWIGDLSQPPHTFDTYHEFATLIKVQYEGIIGWYLNYLWTSNDQSMLFAREVYGWPGMLCDNERLRFDGSQILGECHRNGVRLVRIVFNVTSPPPHRREKPVEDEYAKLWTDDFLQIKKIPSPQKDGKPLKQLIHLRNEDARIYEIWKGDVTLELGQSGCYPNLHRMNPTEIVAAYFIRSEWVLPYSPIIWEKS